MFASNHRFLPTCLSILTLRVRHQVGLFCCFAFTLLLALNVDLLHLVLISIFIITGFLSVALLLMHSHLLLLFQKEYLLDLLLSKLLVDHFLLSWEVIFLDLLSAAFNLKLTILLLVLILIFLLLMVIHCLLILLIDLLLLLSPIDDGISLVRGNQKLTYICAEFTYCRSRSCCCSSSISSS